MIFTSLIFLVFYIVLVGLLLTFKNNTVRQSLLLLSSYFFYGWWNPAFIILIMASSIWGWYLGLLMGRTDNEREKSLYLAISLSLSIAMLAYYKYAEFLAENFVTLLGLEWDYHLGITLPVGISFFTFQTMSYGIDLKRGRIPVCKSLPDFMLFVAFFPQLVAGPIVRASEFLPQLSRKINITWPNMIIGAQLFLGGAIQKVLFADNLSVYVDAVFLEPSLYSAGTLWLATMAYAMQIFCDFSGYSLMAIGVARTLGFMLPENFRMPYIAKSITEFWRRWHMSLSFWLRDYLYISMGGNRKGNFRTYVHLMITMLLGGLWHGASWNFVIWGALHGIALAIHKLWESNTHWLTAYREMRIYKALAWSLTLLFVIVLWVPFRSPDIETTFIYLTNMLGNETGISWMHPNVIMILTLSVIWHLLYVFYSKPLLYFPTNEYHKLYPQIILSGFMLMIILFAPMNTSPFVYFQF